MGALKDTRANRERIRLLPKSWQDVATGKTPLDTLSDEEVFAGRLRGPNGSLNPRPDFYPQNFIDEQIRRSLNWANDEIRSGMREAIQVFRDIMKNGQFDSDRIKAAQFFTDRFLGKDVQRVLVTAEDPVETLFRAILEDPHGLAGAPPPHELSADEREMLS